MYILVKRLRHHMYILVERLRHHMYILVERLDIICIYLLKDCNMTSYLLKDYDIIL